MESTNVSNVLQQLLSAGTGPVPVAAQNDFHDLARQAAPDDLSQGLAAAFNSSQTPAFGEMVAHMFDQANAGQKAGIVNKLLSGLGPAAMTILSQLGLSAAIRPEAGAVHNMSTDQATQLSLSQVQQIANQAQSANPGIVESMSNFYAQHPVLVKSLGAAALAIILGKIRNR